MVTTRLASRGSVLAAVAECDRLGREGFLDKYGFRPAKAYFLLLDGRHYDSKAILGAAHGYEYGRPLRPDEFSGGEAQTASVLRNLGFDVTSPTQQPDWTPDELILVLDHYLRTRGTVRYGAGDPGTVALSELVRSLPLFPAEVANNPGFRNVNGVKLKLHNFGSLDPENAGSGMRHIGSLDRLTWEMWHTRQAQLQEVAEAIRVGFSDRSAHEMKEAEDEEELGEQEGRLLYRKHRSRERNRALAKRKKAKVIAETGRLSCEVCGFESAASYGPTLAGIIDVHHIRPLSDTGERRTTTADLALLCPTCHRAIHKHPTWIPPSELRRIWQAGSTQRP